MFGRASFGLSRLASRSFGTTAELLKGHSKWQNIKATKGKNDMIKSQAVNQLLRKVRSAVQRGGFDLKINSELAGLEQDFKKQGLPLDTFKSFLVKLKEKPDQTFHLPVIGPSGTFFIIVAEGPQKNTVESSIRKYFNKIGGGTFRLVADSSGVRSWFEEKGVVTAAEEDKDKKKLQLEQVEELGIELDCEEVSLVEEDEGRKFELLCDPKHLSRVEKGLEEKGLLIENADIEFRPTHPVVVSDEDRQKIEKLYEFLQEDEMVSQIFDNVDPGN